MLHLILKILPMAIATSLSAGLFLLMMLILSSKTRQVQKGWAYVAGVVLALLGIAFFVGTSAGHTATASGHRGAASYVLDLALGLLALGILAKILFFPGKKKEKKESEPKEKAESKRALWQYFAGGFLARLLSLDTIFAYVGAVKEIAQAKLALPEMVAAHTFNIAVSILPLLIPVALFMVSSARALAILTPIKAFVERNRKKILCVILAVIGIHFAVQGIRGLLLIG